MRKAILILLAMVAVASADPWAARLGEWVALQQRRAVVVDPVWDSLVAYYPLNGTAKDLVSGDSGTLSDVTFTNFIPFVESGSAAQLQRTTNSFIELVNNTLLHNETAATLSFWIYVTARPSRYEWYLYSFGGSGERIGVQGWGYQQAILVQAAQQSYTTTINEGHFTDNTWINYVMTVSFEPGNRIRVYRDGALIDDRSVASTQELRQTVPFLINGKQTSNLDNWAGYMDEVAIWNRTLSSNEVFRIYDEQLIYRQ